MRPIIGILAEVDEKGHTRVRRHYVQSIENSNGIPLLLPYTNDEGVIDGYVELCDGFMFTGGADINPARYGEEKKPLCEDSHHLRDEFEFALFDKAIKTNKPILAICRGSQLINAALGGTLYQDIPTEVDTKIIHRQTVPKTKPSHSVNIAPDTPLAKMIGKDTMSANSFHHQAVKKLAPGLKVMATADDGLIEAYCLDSERYLLAYQWHPERLCNADDDNKKIFDSFIDAASH